MDFSQISKTHINFTFIRLLETLTSTHLKMKISYFYGIKQQILKISLMHFYIVEELFFSWFEKAITILEYNDNYPTNESSLFEYEILNFYLI